MSRPVRAGRATGMGIRLQHGAVRLVHADDTRPGIRREKRGRGFAYRDPDGRLVKDARELDRIRSLAIPPAWTDVWISPSARGHIQATGRDARRRKQYRYHPGWTAMRGADKYARLEAFARALPALRRRVRADLARPGLPRLKVIAAVVHLLEHSLIRVGNDEYARTNGSYGLTTMLDRHVRVTPDTVRFRFRGKSGKVHETSFANRRIARIVRRCRELPGSRLFQYVDGHGALRDLTSSDVNAYLRRAMGEAFTAKDFRTWAGTTRAAALLLATTLPASRRRREATVAEAMSGVAAALGNTRAVCRRCYVHPVVIDAFLDGSLHARLSRPVPAVPGLRQAEAAVLRLLRRAPRQALAAA